ncbi:hypothetical protein P3G55_26125, partial [Leptospira sp. 96542]|nr:hypothetical protein [Leptospira sp. 96542]
SAPAPAPRITVPVELAHCETGYFPKGSRPCLDETARSQGFHLQSVIDADSLRLQKQVLVDNPHLYALLGPFSIDEELRQGKLQATKLVAPELKRYVTLAHPKWGQLTQASRIVSQLIRETVQAWGGQMKPPAPVGPPVPQ